MTQNKKKIINDPVYGFVHIRYEIIFDLLSHPWLQRLRNIKQMAMAHLVYPGALHTRLQHALGAMHLMALALDTLRSKGLPVTEEEAEAATIAILLHDVGHGPFSHALEHTIVEDISHEDISLMVMDRLNTAFNGRLSMAIEIFNNTYPKKFLHELVSGQLDMDRMDYLNRDSFFSGVSEGVISFDRIISMLNVSDDRLVVDEKGIYSIEKFIIARRLMYWQVYLHKTVTAAEQMLIKALRRARMLALGGHQLFCTPAFELFLYNKVSREAFLKEPRFLDAFLRLDDHDIAASLKVWKDHADPVLAWLCNGLTDRRLFRIEIQREPFPETRLREVRKQVQAALKAEPAELDYFIASGILKNSAYLEGKENIAVMMKDGTIEEITKASDNFNIRALSKPVQKYFLCYPKTVMP